MEEEKEEIADDAKEELEELEVEIEGMREAVEKRDETIRELRCDNAKIVVSMYGNNNHVGQACWCVSLSG